MEAGFGREERKGSALELYDALSGAPLSDPGELGVNTMGDAVFPGKNDVSFLVGGEMVLLEHQPTRNPNMQPSFS